MMGIKIEYRRGADKKLDCSIGYCQESFAN